MSKAPSEHLLAVVKAGLSAVPLVGGPVASLIGDYIPTATRRTIDGAMKSLAERLQKLEGSLDATNVDKDEFSEIFKSAYLSIVRTHKKEKIQAAVSLITNSLLKDGDTDKLTFSEADHFARCLEQLSFGAFEVLVAAAGIANASYEGNLQRAIAADYSEGRRFDFGALAGALPQYHPSLLMGLVGELDALNLLHKAGTPDIQNARL